MKSSRRAERAQGKPLEGTEYGTTEGHSTVCGLILQLSAAKEYVVEKSRRLLTYEDYAALPDDGTNKVLESWTWFGEELAGGSLTR